MRRSDYASIGKAVRGLFGLTFAIILLTLRAGAQGPPNAPVISSTVTPSEEGATVTLTSGTTSPGAKFHPSRLLVRFRAGAAHAFLPGTGAAKAFPGDANLFLVPTPPGVQVPEAVERYKANPAVQNAEPDYEVQAIVTPTDPKWSQQWDMTKISAPTAWDFQDPTILKDVVVAVIDTGIAETHEDLVGNIWLDGSGNPGYSCLGGVCAPGGKDDHGHGTHVAGTIGAIGNNGKGIAGLNWNIKIISFKFLNSGGSGSISDAILAFQKILVLKTGGMNIRVTNNSWGGGGFSVELQNAMKAVEDAGILNVCAAGNSGVNVDISPMYPAGYNNKGIISVLATDSGDAGASFTNYGLMNVDIAAPGVSTLSTVPTISCSLCDPSGYKLLSGTSMASPHVAGVAAAMMQRRATLGQPALTAEQAREIMLDPASYDPMSNARAQSTSTGGRLNFLKTLTNPKLGMASFTLNTFPTVNAGADVFTTPNTSVILNATANDPDGDSLRGAWNKQGATVGSTWLMGWWLNTLIPNPVGNPATVSMPAFTVPMSSVFNAAFADNRGGGAFDSKIVTTSAGGATTIPTETLSLSATDIAVGGTVTVTMNASGSGTLPRDVWSSGQGGASGSCCYTSPAVNMTFNSAGVYRVGSQTMDGQLDLSNRPTGVVRVGVPPTTPDPPIAGYTIDKLSGPVPLTVNINMSSSTPTPGGTISYYYFICGGGGFTAGSASAQGNCTYTKPGAYWMMLQVQGSNGQMDTTSAYVVATAVDNGVDSTPPTVSITNPANNSTVSGTVNLTASASDASGIASVAYYRGAGILIGSSSTAANNYAVSWDTSGLTGNHTIYAVATDASPQANAGQSASITLNLNPPLPPTVAITAPLANAQVARKSTVTIEVSVTPGDYAASRVDMLVGNAVVCSDSTGPSPYSCNWKVPNSPNKIYLLTARVYDANGALVATSAAVQVRSN